MNVTVNGHPAEVGCYVGGWWGWRGVARVCHLAVSYGWTLASDFDEGALTNYADTDRPDAEKLHDYVLSMSDDAESWLNEMTEGPATWHWHDGEFYLSPCCDDDPNCDDEECVCKCY